MFSILSGALTMGRWLVFVSSSDVLVKRRTREWIKELYDVCPLCLLPQVIYNERCCIVIKSCKENKLGRGRGPSELIKESNFLGTCLGFLVV